MIHTQAYNKHRNTSESMLALLFLEHGERTVNHAVCVCLLQLLDSPQNLPIF